MIDLATLPDLGISTYLHGPDSSPVDINISGLLSDLDPSKSSCPDKISPKLLKLLADEVSPWLQLLFSASLHQGVIPADWKTVIVSPLFKKAR